MPKRKLSPKLFGSLAMLLWIAASYAPASAQQATPASKPDVQAASESVQRGLVSACANLLEAFKAAEDYNRALEKEIDASKKVNEALAAKAALLESALAAKNEEITALRSALDLKDKALIEYKTALDLAKKEADHQKKVGNRKMKAGFIAGVALGFGIRLLF